MIAGDASLLSLSTIRISSTTSAIESIAARRNSSSFRTRTKAAIASPRVVRVHEWSTRSPRSRSRSRRVQGGEADAFVKQSSEERGQGALRRGPAARRVGFEAEPALEGRNRRDEPRAALGEGDLVGPAAARADAEQLGRLPPG